MRALVLTLVAVLAACGPAKGPAGAPAAVAAFPAARWVPADPTYVIAAQTFRDAQSSFRDAIDITGMVFGVEASEIAQGLQRILAVDPMNPDAVASIGIDLSGSMVLFSEDVDPTFVVHLTSAEAMANFLENLRTRGLRTQSIVSDGVEVFTAQLDRDVFLSWALDKEWLWVHFSGKADSRDWFEHSRKPAGNKWGAAWAWAEGAARAAAKSPGVVGFVDLRDIANVMTSRFPEVKPCADQFAPVERVGVAIETDGKHVAGRLTIDVGGSAQAIASQLVAPPPGWAAASDRAPIAAQWNLDLRSVADLANACTGGQVIGGLDARQVLDNYGVRTVRALVHSLDPDDRSGRGAISLDLFHRRFFASLLDEVPMRSKFEKSRTYGAYQGKHLSVPFVATADYVLDDRVFLAAMGDGLLQQIGTGTPAPGTPPVLAIDLIPSGLPVDIWQWLFQQVDMPSPKRLAQRLQSWADLHLGARIDGSMLLVDAVGTRR
ncbi:MAG: hypothetical protein HOV81_37780 [Kofleriaceae bacterium]|nr:hypothetical protein [Kofleriaceae bacterium]